MFKWYSFIFSRIDTHKKAKNKLFFHSNKREKERERGRKQQEMNLQKQKANKNKSKAKKHDDKSDDDKK